MAVMPSGEKASFSGAKNCRRLCITLSPSELGLAAGRGLRDRTAARVCKGVPQKTCRRLRRAFLGAQNVAHPLPVLCRTALQILALETVRMSESLPEPAQQAIISQRKSDHIALCASGEV